jgi:hypothetical protein
MRVIRIKDPQEAQRCRLAQYLGLPTNIAVSGSTFYGVVRSVREDAGPLWIVAFIPTERKKTGFPTYRRTRGKQVAPNPTEKYPEGNGPVAKS